ncbi:GGDEF domain-containing protein [Glaciecola petra]|uniref:diguanylate cyclase n=1 Tax=Glaciecola petra TaxID=3075602 RepID=A0ABU2ZSH9_9ALTE|nr:tetratricopeptide repeat-containing diguanylate cyclase [Aestuariibacter sp. P117]MDT0595587.1 tetratricopeptide repeat-containing diguanylate cyclase [Aestuariibacter sp. P117]
MSRSPTVPIFAKPYFSILVCYLVLTCGNIANAQDISVQQETNPIAQISDSIAYLEQLRSDKDYQQVHKTLDFLMSDLLSQSDELLTARVLRIRAFTFYEQGLYEEALAAFNKVLKYLSRDDEEAITMRGSTFHQIGQTYKRLKNFEQALRFHNKALAAHTFLQDKTLISKSLKNVAILEFKLNNLRSSLEYVYQSLDLQEELNNPEEHAELLVLAGSTFRQLQRYETSLEYLDKALQMYRDLKDVGKIAESLNQMGLLYTRLGKYEEAQLLYQESIALPPEKVPSKTLAAAYRQIAVYEMDKGKYDFAMEMVQQAHTIFRNADERAKAIITARIIGEIYQKKDNIFQAREYYRESIRLAVLSDSKIGQLKSLIRLASSFYNDDVEKSESLYKEALALAKGSIHKTEVANIYRQLQKIEKERGDFQKALLWSEALIEISTEIYKEREENKLAFAKANLESHIMEVELDSLREKVELDQLTLVKKNNEIEIAKQASRIAELEIIKKRYTNIALFVLLVICFCIAFYIYRVSIASRKRNVELDYLADHDHLTNCFNRRGLFNIFEREFDAKDQTQGYSIIMADIDHFKEVNDTHGHDAGDEVLISFVECLKASVRKGDIVARYGGEEFCLVLPDTAVKQAIAVADKIRQTIENTTFENIRITCSFGIAESNKQDDTPTSIITRADNALYFSKQNGRNQVTLWHKDIVMTKKTGNR